MNQNYRVDDSLILDLYDKWPPPILTTFTYAIGGMNWLKWIHYDNIALIKIDKNGKVKNIECR